MIEIYHTGGGCMAYHVQEPDAPGLYALITAPDGAALPENPEFDPMMIGRGHQRTNTNPGTYGQGGQPSPTARSRRKGSSLIALQRTRLAFSSLSIAD